MIVNCHVEQLCKTIWDYLVLKQPLIKSDCILVFGGHDPSVAIHAAHLYKEQWAPKVIVSGGVTHPASFYGETEERIEAEALKLILLKNDVKEEDIILERKAKNTSENFWFTADLLEGRHLSYDKFILVQKPYTERRTYLTGLNRWPDKSLIVSSANVTFKEYFNGDIPKEKIIDMIVGEVYRLKEYPTLGYFKEVQIPNDVWNAYCELAELGFNKRIVSRK